MKCSNSCLTPQEVSDLLHASEGNQDLHDCIQLVVASGLRVGELQRLTWADVNFVAGTLTIKGYKSGDRIVFLDDRAKQVLSARLSKQFVLGPRPSSTLHRVRLQLRAVAATLGILALEFHDLRTFCATRVFASPSQHASSNTSVDPNTLKQTH